MPAGCTGCRSHFSLQCSAYSVPQQVRTFITFIDGPPCERGRDGTVLRLEASNRVVLHVAEAEVRLYSSRRISAVISDRPAGSSNCTWIYIDFALIETGDRTLLASEFGPCKRGRYLQVGLSIIQVSCIGLSLQLAHRGLHSETIRPPDRALLRLHCIDTAPGHPLIDATRPVLCRHLITPISSKLLFSMISSMN